MGNAWRGICSISTALLAYGMSDVRGNSPPLCASTSYGLIHRLIDEGIDQRLQSRRIGGLILSVQMIPVGPLAPRLATIRSMRAEGCGRGRGAVVGASVLGGGISASRFQRRCGTHTVTPFRMHVLLSLSHVFLFFEKDSKSMLYCSPGPWISL